MPYGTMFGFEGPWLPDFSPVDELYPTLDFDFSYRPESDYLGYNPGEWDNVGSIVNEYPNLPIDLSYPDYGLPEIEERPVLDPGKFSLSGEPPTQMDIMRDAVTPSQYATPYELVKREGFFEAPPTQFDLGGRIGDYWDPVVSHGSEPSTRMQWPGLGTITGNLPGDLSESAVTPRGPGSPLSRILSALGSGGKGLGSALGDALGDVIGGAKAGASALRIGEPPGTPSPVSAMAVPRAQVLAQPKGAELAAAFTPFSPELSTPGGGMGALERLMARSSGGARG
jgi:hypothetical protein